MAFRLASNSSFEMSCAESSSVSSAMRSRDDRADAPRGGPPPGEGGRPGEAGRAVAAPPLAASKETRLGLSARARALCALRMRAIELMPEASPAERSSNGGCDGARAPPSMPPPPPPGLGARGDVGRGADCGRSRPGEMEASPRVPRADIGRRCSGSVIFRPPGGPPGCSRSRADGPPRALIAPLGPPR